MTNKELEIKKELEGTELQDNEFEDVAGGAQPAFILSSKIYGKRDDKREKAKSIIQKADKI